MSDIASPLPYLKSRCVTWLPKTYMLIFAFTETVSRLRYLCPLVLPVTQNIDADILIVWHCLSPPLPKVPLRYLVTQNMHADICLYWHSLSAPLPMSPCVTCYPKHRCRYSHCLTLPLPCVTKSPLALPGYRKHTCWYLPLLTQSLPSVN